MKVSKKSLVLMTVYSLAGVLTGGIFGRSQYYQGKMDAYDEITDKLNKVNKEVEEMIANKEKEGA